MNWYIGQPIVAIVNHSQKRFRKGDEFIVCGLKLSSCKCTPHTLIDISIRDYAYTHTKCVDCNTDRPYDAHYHEDCFAPLDTDISELTEILEQKQIL